MNEVSFVRGTQRGHPKEHPLMTNLVETPGGHPLSTTLEDTPNVLRSCLPKVSSRLSFRDVLSDNLLAILSFFLSKLR
jgi:hypothetical protein